MRKILIEALSGVLWADGVVERVEVTALSAAATVLGLPSQPEDLMESFVRGATGVEVARTAPLDLRERMLVYAGAEWMALVEGRREGEHERRVLDELRSALGLARRVAAKLRELARRVRAAARRAPSPPEFEALLIGAFRLADASALDW